MNTILRRLRGMIGLGLIWSVVWALAGGILGAVEMVLGAGVNGDIAPLAAVLAWPVASALSWGSYGFTLGALFAAVLAFAERRRVLEHLASWRVALWGALAGLIPPVFIIIGVRFIEGATVNNAFVATIGSILLSAGCAAASLALARK